MSLKKHIFPFFFSVWTSLALACQPPWNGPPDYETIFQENKIVTWELSLRAEDWLRLLVQSDLGVCQDSSTPSEDQAAKPCGDDRDCPAGCRCENEHCGLRYVMADLQVEDRLFCNVGLRLMGNPKAAKKNWRIRFDEFNPLETFFGVKRINLRNNSGDPSQIREVVAHQLFRENNLLAPRASLVWLIINGQAAGVYSLVEQVDRKFLHDRLGERDGQLYQIETGGHLVYFGDQVFDYPHFERFYELKTDTRLPNHTRLLELMRCLSISGDHRLVGDLDRLVVLDELLAFWALQAWLSNLDSYLGTGDNLYLYLDASKRFRPIAWNLKRAFGNYHGTACSYSTDQMIELDPHKPTCKGARPLVDRLLENQALKERYREWLALFLATSGSAELLQDKLLSWKRLVSAFAREDPNGGFLAQDFEASFFEDIPAGNNPVRIPGLMPFVVGRNQAIERSLEGN